MRLISSLLAAGALLGLSACATTGEPSPSYAEELEQLAADCYARGGVLRSISSSIGPHAANDYACSISGASRLDHD